MGTARRLPEMARPVLERGGEWHDCVICGRAGVRRFGCHGVGVRLGKDIGGRWYCSEHRDDAARDAAGPRAAQAGAQRQGVLL